MSKVDFLSIEKMTFFFNEVKLTGGEREVDKPGGVGSESDCLLGQLDRILRISNSEAGVKDEKSGGVPIYTTW